MSEVEDFLIEALRSLSGKPADSASIAVPRLGNDSLSRRIGEQLGSGGFQNRYCCFSSYRWKVFEELVQRGAACEIVEEVLYKDTGTREA